MLFNSLWPSDAISQEIWVNIGSLDGLLPDNTKPLPESMLTGHHLKSSDIDSRAISQEMHQPSITKIHLKITCLKFHSNFPGAYELTAGTNGACCPIGHYWHYYSTGALSSKSSHYNSFEDGAHVDLQAPAPQMSGIDLARMRGHQVSSPSNGHQATCPIMPLLGFCLILWSQG